MLGVPRGAPGALLWSGNLGGVVVSLAVQPLVPHGTIAFVGLSLLAVPAVVAAALLPRRSAPNVLERAR